MPGPLWSALDALLERIDAGVLGQARVEACLHRISGCWDGELHHAQIDLAHPLEAALERAHASLDPIDDGSGCGSGCARAQTATGWGSLTSCSTRTGSSSTRAGCSI